MMWLSIFCYIKYKFSLGHKILFNYAMLYFTVLMMISREVLENLENNKTNLDFECNKKVLNKMMLNIWIKYVIDFKYKKNQQDKNINPGSI